ncbi:MAG: hypothetical protein AAF939_13735, partial [Planctomycetota bacterium]
MTNLKFCALFLILGSLILSLGCGPQNVPPEIVAAGGTVTLNGKPLFNCQVEFIPLAKGLDGNYKAFGVTDTEGKFNLELPGSKPGCPACDCKVVVVEGPFPDEARQTNDEGAAAFMKFKKSLTNRPIPKRYQSMAKTPFKFSVADGAQFEI